MENVIGLDIAQFVSYYKKSTLNWKLSSLVFLQHHSHCFLHPYGSDHLGVLTDSLVLLAASINMEKRKMTDSLQIDLVVFDHNMEADIH